MKRIMVKECRNGFIVEIQSSGYCDQEFVMFTLEEVIERIKSELPTPKSDSWNPKTRMGNAVELGAKE